MNGLRERAGGTISEITTLSIATTEPTPTKSLRDADLKATLQHLRQTDLYFVLVLGSTLYFFAHRESWELS